MVSAPPAKSRGKHLFEKFKNFLYENLFHIGCIIIVLLGYLLIESIINFIFQDVYLKEVLHTIEYYLIIVLMVLLSIMFLKNLVITIFKD